jgi:hypothetical protein
MENPVNTGSSTGPTLNISQAAARTIDVNIFENIRSPV